jgi:hypothetical protein
MPGPISDVPAGSVVAAHDELDRLGARHFLDVRATARCMLANMRGAQRAGFAASVAERLVRHDEQRPAGERRRYAETWRPVLDAVWDALAGDRAAHRAAATGVARFYLSPNWLGRRHDDPLDTDDHAIMATVYAAECALHGCAEFAMWAGWRGFDVAAVRAAGDPAWPHRRRAGISPYAWELAHPTVQAELDQQLSDLELLALDGEGTDEGGPADGAPADGSPAPGAPAGHALAAGVGAGRQLLPPSVIYQLRTARPLHQ